MNTDPDHDIIIIEKSINFILTCGYPIETSNIKWNIITPLSGNYDMKKDYNINNKDYRLHSNGTIEIYYRFLVEKSYIVVKCSANNQYWSINKTFHLWEHEAFTKGSMYACTYVAMCVCVSVCVFIKSVMLCNKYSQLYVIKF